MIASSNTSTTIVTMMEQYRCRHHGLAFHGAFTKDTFLNLYFVGKYATWFPVLVGSRTNQKDPFQRYYFCKLYAEISYTYFGHCIFRIHEIHRSIKSFRQLRHKKDAIMQFLHFPEWKQLSTKHLATSKISYPPSRYRLSNTD